VYVAFALPALFLGGVDEGHERLSSALLTVAIFAYLWFLASLRARLVRYDPDGLFASVVVLGGAAYVPLQLIAVLQGSELLAAPSSACAATVVMGSSLAAWRARKIPRWFGQAGIAGAVAILAVGLAEWTVTRDSVFASSLGFMIWVLVTATYLLRR
jgi:predicted permease